MDPPPPAPFPSSSSSSPSSSSNASVTMVIITVVGIFAAFALLASYYAFVTRCQPLRTLLWSRDPPWRRRARSTGTGGGGGGQLLPHQERPSSSVVRAAVARSEHRGLGLPFIRMLPVVKFTAAASAAEADDLRDAGRRISVSECAVCLSEFVERERVRLLPNCSHAFHIDCIDTWLQGSARCPFCRSDVTLPAAVPLPAAAAARVVASKTTRTAGPDDSHYHHHHRRRDDDEVDSIVIEVRGEHETWFGHGGDAGTPSPAGERRHHKKRKAESVGDEALDTRRRSKDDEAFAVVQPLRRSLSLDSSCDKHLYDSVVRELLITTTQRQQVAVYDPSVN